MSEPQSTIPVVNSHPTRKTGVRRVPNHVFQQAPRFANFRRPGVTVRPVVDSDALHQIAALLQMLGNADAGDCEAVRWANDRFLVTSALTDTPNYPPIDQVWQVYQTQNPGFVPGNGPHGYGSNDDRGMDTIKLCEHLQTNGGPDGVKLVAWATVDETDLEEVESAINIFGRVWVDIIVLSGNQREFEQGKPWTNDGSAPEGGHAVLGGGVRIKPVSDIGEFVDIATWAEETSLSPSFWNGVAQGYKMVMGVYVVIWPENLGTRQFQEGVDLQMLIDEYYDSTGKTLDIPTPQPTPTPTPGPQPEPTPTPEPTTPQTHFVVGPRLAQAIAQESVSMGESPGQTVRAILRDWFQISDDDEPEDEAQ